MVASKNIFKKILRSIINNEDSASALRNVSAVDLLRESESKDIVKTANLFLLGFLTSEIVRRMKPWDLPPMTEGAPPSISKGKGSQVLLRQREALLKKYGISDKEKSLIKNLCKGLPLKNFQDVMNISPSNANKMTRALTRRLGLENREQLVFVAGWTRLISLKLPCLDIADEITNLAKK
jgi:DNA-binding CsgD family transcriptional regulator